MRRIPALIAIALLAFSVPVAAQTMGGVACVLGDSEGISPPEARSAAALVCDELAQRGAGGGVMLSDPAQATELYVVDVLPLGRSVIIRVSYEAPLGSVRERRSLTLRGLEETPQAAPRLAEAILAGKSLDETAHVDDLVEQETRTYKKKQGEFLWGVAILATHMVGLDVIMGAGIAGSFYYEAPHFAVGSEIRFSGGAGDDDYMFFSSWSVGGRYLFLTGNWSPYVGGGLGFDGIFYGNDDWDDVDDSGSAYGVGAYVEVGVEVLRLHTTRLGVQFRADLPFFDVENKWFGGDDDKDAPYLVPLTLGVSFSW